MCVCGGRLCCRDRRRILCCQELKHKNCVNSVSVFFVRTQTYKATYVYTFKHPPGGNNERPTSTEHKIAHVSYSIVFCQPRLNQRAFPHTGILTYYPPRPPIATIASIPLLLPLLRCLSFHGWLPFLLVWCGCISGSKPWLPRPCVFGKPHRDSTL